MVQSIVVYSSLALLMMLCGYVASYRERLYSSPDIRIQQNNSLSFLHWETIFPLIVFAIVFGCRFNVGVDYPHYYKDYLFGADIEYEFLFRRVTEIMSGLGIHYAFYFTLWAFIQIFLLFYTFRNQRFLFPFIAFFLIFGSYYLSMMNIIRQQLAACIFMYSIQYIDNKKFYKFLICVFIASMFHISAWLLLIAYPVFQKKKDLFFQLKWQLLFYCIALFLSFNYDLVIEMVSLPFSFFTELFGYHNYLEGILTNEKLNSASQFGNNTGLGFYIKLFLSIPIILYSKKLKDYYNNSFFNIIYSLWFIRILADFIVGDSIILNRPFVYVNNFKIIMLAYFVYYCIKTKKAIPQCLAILFILLHFAMFINILSNGVVNTTMFTFFWQQ